MIFFVKFCEKLKRRQDTESAESFSVESYLTPRHAVNFRSPLNPKWNYNNFPWPYFPAQVGTISMAELNLKSPEFWNLLSGRILLLAREILKEQIYIFYT